MRDLNLLAVAVSAVVAFVISGAWYGLLGGQLSALNPAYADARPTPFERLAQAGVVRSLAVVEDQLGVQVHQTPTPMTCGTRSRASTSASISERVVYTPKLARVLAAIRRCRCSGHAQW